MVFDPVSLGVQFLASNVLSNMFGGGGGDKTGDVLGQYQSDVANRPDYSFLQQDPLVQGLERQGNQAGNVAQQQAMSNLIRSGFGRSNVAAATGARAGATATQPFVNARSNMLSSLQQQAEQQRLQSLRDVLQSRLGKAGRQEQTNAGLGLELGKSLLGQAGGFGDFLQGFGGVNNNTGVSSGIPFTSGAV